MFIIGCQYFKAFFFFLHRGMNRISEIHVYIYVCMNSSMKSVTQSKNNTLGKVSERTIQQNYTLLFDMENFMVYLIFYLFLFFF
jgi:hypothetical protein